MKNLFARYLRVVALAVLCGTGVHAQTYQQVWADEFTNGIGPSWQFENGGGGWGNNEKQYYQPANTSVVNGELQITARKQAVGGMPYTSSRLKTQGLKEFTYGRVEARIKLPLGQGLWPAFWMLGSNINTVSWPQCGEIDVMEQINADSRTYGTVHWDNNGHVEYSGNLITTPNVYHVYAIEWEPSAIRWYVDGVKFHEINITNGVGGTEEFQKPFFLLLNLAVAGNWPGQTVDESKLPATMFVDYVRVYQKTSTPPPATSILLQAEAANVNSGMVVETCTDVDGGQDMGYIDGGDYLVFNNVSFPTSGSYLLEYRVASGANGGTISADLNGGSIQLGNTTIPGTGGWQTWTTVSRTVNVNAGTYNLGIYAQTSGYNLNWVRITKTGAARMAVPAKAPAPASAGIISGPLEVYTNPVVDRLYLNSEASLAGSQYRIINAYGMAVASGIFDKEAINVAGLPAGIYTLVIVSKNQKTSTHRFMK